jgi:hypothetical protein
VNAVGVKKFCPKCKALKNVEEFHRNRSMPDGRQVYCASCSSAYHKEPERLSEKKKYDCSPERLEIARESVKRSKRGPGRFTYARGHAKEKGHSWDLSKEEYEGLVSCSCYYCGGRVSETGIGLDRCDNDLGYYRENVVPCCYLCNTIKSNKFSKSEMEQIGAVLRRIYKVRIGGRDDSVDLKLSERNREASGRA